MSREIATVLVLLLIHTVKLLAQTPVPGPWTYPGAHCVPANTTKTFVPGGYMPPFPVLPSQFQTNVEVVVVDKGFSYSAQEYFDGVNNVASLWFLRHGIQKSIVFDYNTDQLIYVFNSTCIADDIASDSNSLVFGDKYTTGMPHAFGSNAIIHFAKSQGIAYLGNKTVRGLTVDHFQSCMKWPQLKTNFTLDYYFTAPSWTDGPLFQQVPVRAEVTGVAFQGTSYNNIHHIYDYTDFRPMIWADHSVFETPRGVICRYRVKTRDLPKVPPHFSFREELVSTTSQAVSYADIFYDYEKKFVWYDYTALQAVPPVYFNHPATEIHDFNTGAAYVLDNVIGNCSILPIGKYKFDVSRQGHSNFTIKMMSPYEMFFINPNSFSYKGKRPCREMMCYVYTSTSDQFKLPGYAPFNASFVTYFLSNSIGTFWTEGSNSKTTFLKQCRVNACGHGNIDEWIETSNMGMPEELMDVPVKVEVFTPDWVGYKATYNIYNWSDDYPDLRGFDITSCYTDEQQIRFRIDIPGNYYTTSKEYKNVFMDAVTNEIVRITNISPLRLQKTEFHMSDNTSYFVGIMVEAPPALALFQKHPGNYSIYHHDSSLTMNAEPSVSDCADSCRKFGSRSHCNSFYYCPNLNTCYLNKNFTDDGHRNSSGQCSFYSRTASQVSKTVYLSDAWLILRNVIIIGNFTVHVNIGNATEENYTASKVSNGRFDGSYYTTDSVMSQFRSKRNKVLRGHDKVIITGLSIDECASSCIGENWTCSSFNYCFEKGYIYCMVSNRSPDEVVGDVVYRLGCFLYTRKYIPTTTPSPGTTTTSPASSSSSHRISTVKKYLSSAVKQKQSTIQGASLGVTQTPRVTHGTTSNSTSPVPSSSSHRISTVKQTLSSAAKQKSPTIQRTSFSVTQTSRVTADNCAKFCNYSQVKTKESCKNSTSTTNGSSPLTSDQTKTTPGNNGYSSGVVAGIALGMFVLGAILAIGIIFVWMKLRSPQPRDDIAVPFSNFADSEN